MFNLVSILPNLVSKLFGTSTKKAPAPAPKPAAPKQSPLKPLQQLPKYDPYIASWGDSPATIAAGQARNNAQVAATQKVISSNSAQMEANRREMERQAAEREKARREKQAALDKVYADLKTDRTKRAQQALDALMKKNGGTMLSWKSYLNDDGTIKAKGEKVNGFEIPENWYNETGTIQWAKSEWSKWYNSSAGTYQRAKDEYRKKAEKIISDNEKANSGGLWNWLTGAKTT